MTTPEFPLGESWQGFEVQHHLSGVVSTGRYIGKRGAELALITTSPSHEAPFATPRLEGIDRVARLLGVVPFEFEGAEREALVELLGSEDAVFGDQLPVEHARRVALSLFETLAAAHACGAVMGSIRPEFVVLTGGMNGPTFRCLAPRGERFVASAERLSHGVPPLFRRTYYAAEVLGGAEPTQASDVFGAAATVARWVIGEHPFAGSNLMEQSMAIMAGQGRQWPRLSGMPTALLQAALSPDPAGRPTADVLSSAFREGR